MIFDKSLRSLTAGATLLAGVALAVSPVAAQFTISDETGSGTVVTTLGFTAQNDIAQFTVDITFDGTSLTPAVDNPGNSAPTITDCLASAGANWDTTNATSCRLINANTIRVVAATGFAANVPLDTADPFGTITWTVVGDPGDVFPLDATVVEVLANGANQPTSDLGVSDGSITIAVPPNESFYTSNPVPGSTIDFGSAVVGQATSPDETIAVSNASTDTAFDITAAAGNFGVGSGAYSVTSPAIPATVAPSSTVNVNLNCTPGARGNNTGTFTLTTDADNVTTADYPTVCTGLAPNVQVSSTSISLNGVVGGTAPTGSVDVLNPSGNFTSDANNAVVNTTTFAAEISATSDVLADSTISVDEVDSLGYQCSTAAEGTFTEEFQIDYDDPISGGTASTATVTVTCQISDTAPIYNSAPMPGTLIALVTGANSQSPPDGLDINNDNTNPAGDALVISSAVASDPVFTVNVVNPSFDANVAADGNDDIEVTCTPPGVGTINGTLTVQTNASNQPGGGFTYPLSCEGTGDALTTNPDDRGTLNLGTVPPGTTTGEGLINFTNNQIDGDITVDCSVTDTAGVFTFTPDPILFTIPAGDTESAAFQCTPSDISSFTADVSCTLPVRGQGLNFTVACAGRPLVIPTMSRWGLVVMSLVLLLVAGVAGRRMLA